METFDLATAIKQEAKQLGFSLCRIIPIGITTHIDFFKEWIKLGCAAEMTYLERNVEKRRSPKLLSDSTDEYHSLIVLGVDYHQFSIPPEVLADKSRGIVASYAWGSDYHELIRPLLYELDHFIRKQSGRQTEGKCLIDTGPVLERDWAHRAGVGFTGKNCCTINPTAGSWIFLATVLVPEKIMYDDVIPTEALFLEPTAVLQGLDPKAQYGSWLIPSIPLEDSRADKLKVGTCGRCSRCIEACPTNAIVGPYYLDPRKCISYWTIESRSIIPRELRPLFGNRIFGCDICQEVCPWNLKLKDRTPLIEGLKAVSERVSPPLLDGFNEANPYWLDQAAFSSHFRMSPIKRSKRSGMLRNVCVALGNWASLQTVPALILALNDIEYLPRAHAAWALGQVLRSHSSEQAFLALKERLKHEQDVQVREEIHLALN